jgi:hypothetical protein
MDDMFEGAIAFDQPIGEWDVSSVTTMYDMFFEATSFDQDLSDWDVTAVSSMGYMFQDATSFNQPLGDWDVSGVSDMQFIFEGAASFDQDLGAWNLASVTTLDDAFSGSAISCANYDRFLGAAAATGAQGAVLLGGGSYTPDAAAARSILVGKGWQITDSKCPGAWPLEQTLMPMTPLPVFDSLNARKIQMMKVSEVTLAGTRLDLIQSASVDGKKITISSQTATSIRFQFPALTEGAQDVLLQTSNGQLTIARALMATDIELLNLEGLNPRSSFINAKAVGAISDWVEKGQSVVCIAYNDRPGVVARAKAKSRAEHACRIAAASGATTRVFVFGKAPGLASSLKLVTKGK